MSNIDMNLANRDPNRKILVVDDEPELLDLLGDILNPISDEIITAENGLEALSVLEANPDIHAILSDIQMPRMNGLELLSRIRSQFNPIPFVVLTAFGDSKSYQEAIRLNATDFLEKPIVFKQLQLVMTRAIRYGISIQQLNHSLNEVLAKEQIPAEISESIKRARRTVMLMRIESSIYLQKSERKN
ncbi:MAG: response regulator [Bdellovibrionales bacterium]|nr:response regulator [Bdellovibrionales bacterium]